MTANQHEEMKDILAVIVALLSELKANKGIIRELKRTHDMA